MGFSPGAVAVLSQVHGDRVLPVNAGKGGLSSVGEADAAVCTTPDVLLVVRVADCVPVLLAVPGGVAVAHAGWRGTAAGVVANAVQALCAATGMPTESVVAAIGPHISQAHFQVGEEVVEALRGTGVDLEGLIDRTRAKPHVDLGGVVERQLRAAGVECVDRVGGCSYADLQYFSHRRDGERAGRMAGVIGLRASR